MRMMKGEMTAFSVAGIKFGNKSGAGTVGRGRSGARAVGSRDSEAVVQGKIHLEDYLSNVDFSVTPKPWKMG